jgi:aryl-alcohol dehydrogenase-like predicted oxidoreductase
METRRFGRTGHMSTVAIFGAAAFWEISQADADKVMEQVTEAGINHIDVAPSYGQAEERVGPWMPRERGRFFLGCKTMERTKQGAWDEMQRSLKRLQTESFDLYQCHAITTMEELDAVTMKDGALEAFVEARERGLTKFIGITGHGVDAPKIYLEALRRFDFDSILFPLNYVQMRNPEYKKNAEELIETCKAKDVGTMVIKTITKGPWGEREHTANTWYEPFDKAVDIQKAVNYALSYEVTGLCTAGDTRILPMVLRACENFERMKPDSIEEMIRSGQQYEPLFV